MAPEQAAQRKKYLTASALAWAGRCPKGPRRTLSIAELNRVLGGGIVPGSCVLVGGDPGIGKSTLLLQMAAEIADNHGPVLYVSAEESAHQIGRRAGRLGVKSDRLLIFSPRETRK